MVGVVSCRVWLWLGRSIRCPPNAPQRIGCRYSCHKAMKAVLNSKGLGSATSELPIVEPRLTTQQRLVVCMKCRAHFLI